ncbi:hypothetical protein BS47DRAFT_1398789 [Hydnum rufescens UP504]|uniref:Uncharacterized protein n=1 Tax=Hydnum rufescens UP504 TaxID=1448309 RepID=A0A9P6AK31_9AGAM|nr:hypothetical protein BS47DRAFT_1398789 [Hydnum rufescens UP504]
MGERCSTSPLCRGHLHVTDSRLDPLDSTEAATIELVLYSISTSYTVDSADSGTGTSSEVGIVQLSASTNINSTAGLLRAQAHYDSPLEDSRYLMSSMPPSSIHSEEWQSLLRSMQYSVSRTSLERAIIMHDIDQDSFSTIHKDLLTEIWRIFEWT